MVDSDLELFPLEEVDEDTITDCVISLEEGEETHKTIAENHQIVENLGLKAGVDAETVKARMDALIDMLCERGSNDLELAHNSSRANLLAAIRAQNEFVEARLQFESTKYAAMVYYYLTFHEVEIPEELMKLLKKDLNIPDEIDASKIKIVVESTLETVADIGDEILLETPPQTSLEELKEAIRTDQSLSETYADTDKLVQAYKNEEDELVQ